MKKFLSYFVLIISLTFILIYALAFTPWGNSIVSGLVENKINEKKVIDFKFEKFVLSINNINIQANIDSNSKISIVGKYSIFDMGVNLSYNLDIENLSKLEKFTKEKLNGPLKVNGIVIGNQKLLTIKGTSDIFSSNTRYFAKLVDFEPMSISLKVINVNIEKALYTVNQPSYAKGYADILVNIKNAKINDLDGVIEIKVYNGLINNKTINKKFNLKLKKQIKYSSNLNARLLKDSVISDFVVSSSLFNFIVKKAKLNTKDLNLTSDYNLDVKKLSAFNDISQMKLKGSFYFKGNVEKIKDNISFNTKSNIFKSNTNISAKLISNKLKDLKIDIKKLNLKEALNAISMPMYASGYLDMNANIPNANMDELKGSINTKVYNGVVNNALVNKDFDLKLVDRLTFKTDFKTILKDNHIYNTSNIYTSKANVFVKETKINLKTMKIESDYKIQVEDLSKLYDLSSMKMRGSAVINGTLVKDENMLLLGKSNLLDGSLNYKLLNSDFTAKIKDINVLKTLHMMYFPEVLKSTANVDLKYNLENKIGTVNGLLINGRFVKNEFSSMLNNFARFDITKEVYEKITLDSKINKNIINSTMHFKSKLTKLDMTKSVLDTEKMITDSYVKVNIKGIKFDTSIKGNVSSPKIKLHIGSALQATIDAKKDELLKKLNIDKLDKDNLKRKLKEQMESGKFKKEKKRLEEKLKNKFKSLF